ncbi:hypothetical protein [Nocardioides jensenii]|uniref:hypothetical protein n=1 Tax=Nocardioides jensenii TaxID=1843 RepID=UPI0008360CE0|nr:hypothetical protein [Nocardioides jensenii]
MDPHTDGHALREVLHSSMDDVLAPTGVEAGARSRGRRLRARRRLASGVAVAAVAATVAIGVPMAIGQGDGVDERPSDAAVAADPSTDPSATESRGGDEDGWWSMPASEMAETLTSLLPGGVTLSDPELINTDRAPGEAKAEMEGYLVATLTTEDGPGKVNLAFSGGEPAGASTVDGGEESNGPSWIGESQPDAESSEGDPVEAAGPEGDARYNCDPTGVTNPKDCTVIRDDAGQVIGRILDTTVNGVRDLSVTLVTPDDGTVMIDVANTLSDKWPDGATATSPDVALSLAQLRAIAENPVWTSYQP